MGEVALVVSDAGDGLRERLDEEINSFNAGGHRVDRRPAAELFRPVARVVTCTPGSSGGRGVDAATSICCGCGRTAVGLAWVPGCSPRLRRRSGGVAAIRWP